MLADGLYHGDHLVKSGRYEGDPDVIVSLFDLLDELLHGRVMQRGRRSLEVLGNEIDAPLGGGGTGAEDPLGPHELVAALVRGPETVAVLLAEGLADTGEEDLSAIRFLHVFSFQAWET